LGITVQSVEDDAAPQGRLSGSGDDGSNLRVARGIIKSFHQQLHHQSFFILLFDDRCWAFWF